MILPVPNPSPLATKWIHPLFTARHISVKFVNFSNFLQWDFSNKICWRSTLTWWWKPMKLLHLVPSCYLLRNSHPYSPRYQQMKNSNTIVWCIYIYIREALNWFCDRHGFAGWFESSAKLNINIEEANRFLVEKVLERTAGDMGSNARRGMKVFLSSVITDVFLSA